MKNFKEYRKIKSEYGLITEQQFMTDKSPENLEVTLVGSNQNPVVPPINIPLQNAPQVDPAASQNGQVHSEVTQDHLITKLANSLLQLRILHWNTTEYSQHMATGSIYDDLDDVMDKFVETYQGYYPRVKFCDCLSIRNIEDLVTEEWIISLDQDIESLRSMCPQTDLQNILDEIRGLFGKLKYLFTLK